LGGAIRAFFALLASEDSADDNDVSRPRVTNDEEDSGAVQIVEAAVVAVRSVRTGWNCAFVTCFDIPSFMSAAQSAESKLPLLPLSLVPTRIGMELLVFNDKPGRSVTTPVHSSALPVSISSPVLAGAACLELESLAGHDAAFVFAEVAGVGVRLVLSLCRPPRRNNIRWGLRMLSFTFMTP